MDQRVQLGDRQGIGEGRLRRPVENRGHAFHKKERLLDQKTRLIHGADDGLQRIETLPHGFREGGPFHPLGDHVKSDAGKPLDCGILLPPRPDHRSELVDLLGLHDPSEDLPHLLLRFRQGLDQRLPELSKVLPGFLFVDPADPLQFGEDGQIDGMLGRAGNLRRTAGAGHDVISGQGDRQFQLMGRRARRVLLRLALDVITRRRYPGDQTVGIISRHLVQFADREFGSARRGLGLDLLHRLIQGGREEAAALQAAGSEKKKKWKGQRAPRRSPPTFRDPGCPHASSLGNPPPAVHSSAEPHGREG